MQAFQVAQWQRVCLSNKETWVRSLGQEESLEEEMATHSSILAWEISWAEETRSPYGHKRVELFSGSNLQDD